MKKITYLSVLTVTIILSGCGNESCLVKEEISIGNNIFKIIEKDKCHDNQIIVERQFIKISKDSTQPYGVYREYYPNGQQKIYGFYKNGLQDSSGIQFYPNGEKQVENFFADGQLFGPQYTFYEDGRARSISFHKNDTIHWFGIDYNVQGHIEQLFGTSHHNILNPGYENAKINDNFACITEVPIVDSIKTILNIKLKRGDNILLDTTIANFQKLLNTYIYPYSTILNNKGEYQYVTKVQLRDSRTNKTLKEDSTILTINVK